VRRSGIVGEGRMIDDVMNDVNFDTLNPGNAEDEMKEEKPVRGISRC